MPAHYDAAGNRILLITAWFGILLVVAIYFIDRRPPIAQILSHEIGRARYYDLMGREFAAQSTRKIQDAIHARDKALHERDSLMGLRQHDREQFDRWYRLRRRDGEQLLSCRTCLYDDPKECGYISHGR